MSIAEGHPRCNDETQLSFRNKRRQRDAIAGQIFKL